MYLSLLFFDNPFPDSLRINETNFEKFNLLKVLNTFLMKEVNKSANPQISLDSHVCKSIFAALIRTVDAQSFLRFIFKNILVKINLVQLETFINEKIN